MHVTSCELTAPSGNSDLALVSLSLEPGFVALLTATFDQLSINYNDGLNSVMATALSHCIDSCSHRLCSLTSVFKALTE